MHARATASTTPPGADTPLLERSGPVATLRLRRPAQRNALRDSDLRILLEHLDTLDADPGVRVVVLAGQTLPPPARPVFCAGYDVSGFDAPGHDPRLFESVPDRLEALRPVTVCAMNGHVFGGAIDLMLACDLRLATAGIEWRMPAVALGLHLYPQGLRRLVSRLGPGLAQRAFLTARAMPVSALEAAGLLEAVVEPGAFDAALAALVADVAALAPLAAASTEASLRELAQGRFDGAALLEREASSLRSADFAEGRAAARERRTPRFTGR